MKNRKSAILSRLNQDSLLSLIPGFLELCLDYGQIRRLRARELVCRQGDHLDHLIIPIVGSLRMQRRNVHEDKEVGVLQESRALGLRQILFSEPTPFSASSDGDSQILAVPADRFLDLLNDHLSIRHYLQLMVSSSGVRSFRELLKDRRIKIDTIIKIFSLIDAKPLCVKSGDTLDMSVPSLWFVTSGALSFGAGGKSGASKKSFAEGSYFGAEALTAPYSYSYRLTSQIATTLFKAELSKLKPILLENGLVDVLIISSRSLFRSQNTKSFSKWDSTFLPGRPLTKSEIISLKIPVDEKKVRFGLDAENSKFDSVHNFTLFLEHPVQIGSVHLDLRLQGISYVTLAQSLERFGFVCRASDCSVQELGRQPVPSLIGYGPRWSVLLGKHGNSFWLIDPIQGFLAVAKDDFEKHWNGEVFYAESAVSDWVPNSATKPFEIVMGVFRTATPHLGSLFGVRILSLLLGALAPIIAGYMVERVTAGASFSEISGLTLVGMLVFILISALSMVAGLIGISLDQCFDFRLNSMFFRMVTRLRPTAKVNLGQLCTYEREFTGLAHFWLRALTHVSFDLASILLYSVMLGLYDLRFPLLGASLVVVLTTVRMLSAGRQRALYEKQLDASSRIRQMASEVVSSISTIKAAGAETISRHALEGVQLIGWRLRMKTGKFQIGLEGGMEILSVLAMTATLYLATHLYLTGQIGIGQVMTVNVLMMSLLSHLHVIAAQVGALEEVRASARKINEFFQLPSDSAAESVISDLNASLSGHIEFDHVTFGYPGSPRPIFNDLSFSIYPNQTVAIVGKSGTGKSTLAKLISGEVQPTSGRIFLDGYDINFLSPECKRREIGMVLQKNELFAGSIAENVAFAADNPNLPRVERAIDFSEARSFIDGLHRGLNHHLAENGLGLSGGEKQRIAIARAIYSKPNIYIFDEATSALDGNTEAGVVNNMRKFLAGRTAIIIAHRLSTIRAADRILVIGDGRLVEDGTHDELIRKNGFYAELFGDQFAIAQGQA